MNPESPAIDVYTSISVIYEVDANGNHNEYLENASVTFDHEGYLSVQDVLNGLSSKCRIPAAKLELDSSPEAYPQIYKTKAVTKLSALSNSLFKIECRVDKSSIPLSWAATNQIEVFAAYAVTGIPAIGAESVDYYGLHRTFESARELVDDVGASLKQQLRAKYQTQEISEIRFPNKSLKVGGYTAIRLVKEGSWDGLARVATQKVVVPLSALDLLARQVE